MSSLINVNKRTQRGKIKKLPKGGIKGFKNSKRRKE
jgi:hypothetical protein